MTSEPMRKHVGPEPVPEHLYAARQLPGRTVALWVGKILVIVAGIGLLLGVFVVSLYRLPAGETVLRPLSRVLPLPALSVNGMRVSYKEYRALTEGWLQLYGHQDVQATELLQERVTDRLIRDVLLLQLSEELNMTLSDEAIAQAEQAFIDQYATEAEYEAWLYGRFGWTREAFVERIVVPLARARQLDEAVLAYEPEQAQPLAAIQDMHRQVTANRDRLQEIASNADREQLEGELVPVADFAPDTRLALRSTPEGSLTDVVEEPYAYAFYAVMETRGSEADLRVRVERVSVPKRDIYDVLQDRYAAADIRRYLVN